MIENIIGFIVVIIITYIYMKYVCNESDRKEEENMIADLGKLPDWYLKDKKGKK